MQSCVVYAFSAEINITACPQRSSNLVRDKRAARFSDRSCYCLWVKSFTERLKRFVYTRRGQTKTSYFVRQQYIRCSQGWLAAHDVLRTNIGRRPVSV